MPRTSPLRNRVKELRERLNIRQSELAQEAGITRQTIIAIEKGRLNPSVLICLKLSKMLREPVDYIFYLEAGYDYEQEARENATRPKRGRKKRSAVAPVAEPVAAMPRSASFEAERNADGDLDDEPILEPKQDRPEPIAAPVAPAPAPAPKKRKTEPTPDEHGEEGKSGQAIWDFF
ncbi:MAG: helix-turn-helix transcriptional regulator [Candidatus Hydrogenedentes bacterium]|nr:helix-turn-helix transcriptional regulator [Candidatus Hydrogenedentota bacterium]